MTSGTACDRSKAHAILAHVGRASEYDPVGDYWIETTEDGEENLVTHGGDVVASNNETTSWLSPGFPSAPTYVVCGQEPDGPWETVEDDLDDFAAGEDWLRENFARFPEYTTWYVDRADNEGQAESYWSIRNGDLIHTN